MTYRLPGPSVTQILMRSSQTLADSQLLTCLIGPLYQVATDENFTITLPVGSPTTISYPNLKVGAIIDDATISVGVLDAKVAIINSGTSISGLTITAGTNSIVASTPLFANVVANDVFRLSGNSGSYTIASVSSDYRTLTLTTLINHTPTTETYGIERSVGDITATVSATYGYTSMVISGLTYAGNIIISGSTNMSYVALRKDLTGFYEVTSYDTLVANMDIHPSNPIGFNAGIIMPTASGGRNILLYILSNDSTVDYLAALNELSTRRDSYFIVPMTSNETVSSAVSSHATTMSQPIPSYFRSALITTELTTSTRLTNSIYYYNNY